MAAHALYLWRISLTFAEHYRYVDYHAASPLLSEFPSNENILNHRPNLSFAKTVSETDNPTDCSGPRSMLRRQLDKIILMPYIVQ